jgi:hypothetical protein
MDIPVVAYGYGWIPVSGTGTPGPSFSGQGFSATTTLNVNAYWGPTSLGYLGDAFTLLAGSLPSQSNPSWLGTFASSFVHGIGHARRPGQSFGGCVAQNASLTLTGSSSHLGTIAASAVTAAVGLGSYLKEVPVYTEEGELAGYGAASFIWAARGMAAVGTAVGAPPAAAPYVVSAAAGLSDAAAVLGSAGFGVLIGSAANCAAVGVNP